MKLKVGDEVQLNANSALNGADIRQAVDGNCRILETGSPERNQQLSLERAETVANELVKMGVDRDNIIVEAKAIL